MMYVVYIYIWCQCISCVRSHFGSSHIVAFEPTTWLQRTRLTFQHTNVVNSRHLSQPLGAREDRYDGVSKLVAKCALYHDQQQLVDRFTMNEQFVAMRKGGEANDFVVQPRYRI